MCDDIGSCWSCLEELPQKMDDPDRPRIQYELAVLQHQQNLVELALHQVDVTRRRRKRRGRRRFWVRPWIGSLVCMTSYLWKSVMKTRHISRPSCGCPRDVRRATNQSGPEDHQAEYNIHTRVWNLPSLCGILPLGPSITQCPMGGGCLSLPYPCSSQKCARPSSMSTRIMWWRWRACEWLDSILANCSMVQDG